MEQLRQEGPNSWEGKPEYSLQYIRGTFHSPVLQVTDTEWTLEKVSSSFFSFYGGEGRKTHTETRSWREGEKAGMVWETLTLESELEPQAVYRATTCRQNTESKSNLLIVFILYRSHE